jgi:hypothetical protein
MGFLDGIDQYLSGVFGSPQPVQPPVQMPPVQTLEANTNTGGFPPVQDLTSGPSAQPSTATPTPIQPPAPTFPNGQVPLPRPNPSAIPNVIDPSAGAPTSLVPPNPSAQSPPSLPPQANVPMPQPRPQAPPSRPSDNPVLQSLFSQSNMQGVGKGLASVAQNWNKPALAAFAGSAGNTMEGQAAASQEEQKHALATRKQNFDEISGDFRDWITAKQQDSTDKMRAAQSKYLGARAEAIMNGGSTTGGIGNNAGLNSPFGRMITIDKMVDARKESEAKTMREANKGRTPDEQVAAQKDLDNKFEQLRQQQYQKYGISPQVADQMKKMGTGAPVKNADGTYQKNPDGSYVFPQDSPPFDTRTMTEDQFHAHVPMGAYYIGQDGQPYQRTRAPGFNKQSEAAPNYDDMQAMSAS